VREIHSNIAKVSGQSLLDPIDAEQHTTTLYATTTTNLS